MNIIKKIGALAAAVALSIGGLTISASAAQAAGSDGPTPYTVTATGVQLPEGDTFRAHGHINWRTTLGSGGMHFDPNNGHPGGAFIGQSFFPITLAPGECITWVQISHYNEHFGEGGQAPVCAPKDEPPVKPGEPDPVTGSETRALDPECVTPLDGTASVVTEGRSWSEGWAWDEAGWQWVPTERVYTDWAPLSSALVQLAECAAPVPPTPTEPPAQDAPAAPPETPELAATGGQDGLGAVLAGAGLLGAGALTLLIRRMRASS